MHVLSAVGRATAALVAAVDLGERVVHSRCSPAWLVGAAAGETRDIVQELYGDAGYWPTPWLGGLLGGHLQSIWYGLNPLPPKLGPVNVEKWRMPDGGQIGLAWPEAPPSLPPTAPIVLVLPGLCGSIDGAGHSVSAAFAAGVRPVCLHARGCGQPLTTDRFNLFGDTDDLRAAVDRILRKWPGAPLCMYGISAGTGLLVRYLGEEGAAAPVAAAVANSPGYDIGVCLRRVQYLYDAAFYVKVLKKHWLEGRNGEVLRAASAPVCERMAQAADMHAFMVAASPFAQPGGVGAAAAAAAATETGGLVANSFATFLQRSNPMGVAHNIRVPALILNADDDPICAALNTDENNPRVGAGGVAVPASPTAVLLRYRRGGHCSFARGWRAHRWSDELAMGFLAEVARRAAAAGDCT